MFEGLTGRHARVYTIVALGEKRGGSHNKCDGSHHSTRRDKDAMAFIPIANCAQVEVRYTLFAQQIENTLYFQHATGIAPSDLAALGSSIDAWVDGTLLVTGLSQDLVYRETYCTDLTSATAPTDINTTNAGATGSNASPALPGGSCIAIAFRTAGRGRSARGRNYISGLTESNVTGNTVGGGMISALEIAYNALLTVPPAGWQWVVASRYTAGAPRVSGVTFPVVLADVSDDFIDSQRRRLTGRGT